MDHARASEEIEKVSIARGMNNHGSMTVEVIGTNATRHVVEYATPDLERTLAALPVGATIPLELEPVVGRANVWRATGMYPRLNDSTDRTVQLVR